MWRVGTPLLSFVVKSLFSVQESFKRIASEGVGTRSGTLGV